ncbi:MAG: hypothetical protein HQM10_11385 [Candidatus Riflebacteria bacterium]|nr:hypothetical protein [Candidatus Riflebacteria bacterium]
MNRIAITGVGMVTPSGNENTEISASLIKGKAEFTTSKRFLSEAFFCSKCAQVPDFNPEKYVNDVKSLRLMNHDSIFAVVAARLAVTDSGMIAGKHYRAQDIALYGATGLAGITLDEVFPLIRHSVGADGKFDPKAFGESALHKVRPTLSFKILSNMPLCFVSINEGIMGENAVYNPWEGQGVQAILAGCRAILSGAAECALVGGCDVKAHELGFISLQQQGVLDSWKEKNKGCVPGEGAAFLLLEREDSAKRRNARIHAVIEGITSFSTEEQLYNFVKSNLSSEASIKLVVSSEDGNSCYEEFENVVLKKLQIENCRKIVPKLTLGNLFAASAAIQTGAGALAVSESLDSREKTLVFSMNHGSGKAAFILGKPDETIVPAISSPARRRVVVTGKGIVSPIGNSVEEYWKSAVSGISGVSQISLFDISSFPIKIGGEVKAFNFESIWKEFPGTSRERDRKVFFGLSAAREALLDAHLISSNSITDSLKKAVLLVGVSLEVFYLEDVISFVHSQIPGKSFAKEYLEYASLSGTSLQTPLDRISKILGDHYGIGGGLVTNCSACAAGSQVIGEAFQRIRNGETDIALAGAADSMLNPLGLGGFSLLRALSPGNEGPEKACRPFDVSRDGTVLSEGSGFLVLEELNSALARGAKIYAEILGYGSSLDAFRVSDPDQDGKGAVLCMRKALSDARLTPEEIDCVNAHGTGTPKNDIVETMAIKEVFGKRAYNMPVHSLKSMTGHIIAASGAVEAVAAVMTLLRGEIPPTINLENPDPLCDLDYVPAKLRSFTGNKIISNSFAFGGQNASIIFSRY